MGAVITETWPIGPGTMRAAIREHDWSATPLGPIDAWDRNLRAAVDVCLGSGFATFVWWGRELVQIYNDAALPIVRSRHPAAFGVPAAMAWADVWTELGPLAERVMREGEPVVGEDRALSARRDGAHEQAFFTFSFGMLRDEAGAVAGVCITAIETTEKLRAQAAQRSSDQRLREVVAVAGLSADFRALFEAAPTPLLVLAPPDFRIVAANDAYLRATMTRREDILGREFFEVFPDDPREADATGAQQLRASFTRVLASRRPDAMAVQRHPIRRPAGEGGEFEERWWSPMNMPVPGADGEVAFIIHRAEDVTEIVRLRSESEASDQTLRDQQAMIKRLREANREAAQAEAELAAEVEGLRRLQQLSSLIAHTADIGTLCGAILDELVRLHGADFGKFQLVDPSGGLRIVAQRGFDMALLDHLAVEGEDATVCGAAFTFRRRVVIADVEHEPTYARHLPIARRLGWRAVQSTPLFSTTGALIGMLTTHFRAPRRFSERELRLTDLFAGIAGDAVAMRMNEEALRASQARQTFLLKLGDALRPLADAHEIQREASRVLREHLGADNVVYAETVAEDIIATMSADRAPGAPEIVGRHRLSDYGPVPGDLLSGRVDWRDDVAADARFTHEEKAAFADIGAGAFANAPLVKGGKLVAMLTVFFDAPHAWSRAELELLEEVAERTWAATERARAEAALRASEARFRLLFDSIDQGFCTIRVVFDDAGRPVDFVFLEVNAAFVQQTGLTDAVGRSARELVPDIEPSWFEIYGRIARTGVAERFEKPAAALHHWYDVYAFRIGEPEEHQLAVLFADVMERKRAEQALRDSEGRLRAALQAGNMASWSWDPALDRLFASDTLADVFGLRPGEELRSRSEGMVLIHPDDLERQRSLVDEAVRTDGTWHSEFRIVRPRDRQVAWLEERAMARRDPATGQLRIDGLVWDVTQRKEAEAALLEADRAKNRFLAVVTHELKNPLNRIKLNAELLSKLPEARTQPAIPRTVDALRKTVGGLTELVDDLLDLSRANTGKLSYRPRPIDLGELVTSILPASQAHARAKGVDFGSDIAQGVRVNADPTRMEQVVSNLLSNALKFTPSGGRIEVRVQAAGGEALVQVSDTGQGIHPQALSRIFDMFVQEDRAQAGESGGLGIGLALVKQITELHGGRADALSEGVGRGATFRVRLPLAEAAHPRDRQPWLEAPRLLLIEDETDSAEAMRQLLELEGYAVDVARGGREALDIVARRRAYDVIVSDISMPGMDGWELIRMLRANPPTATVAAVAVTAWAGEDTVEEMIAAGFDGAVSKPVDLDVLLAVTETALRKREAMRHR
jgi:PAS domain S-box-containing protein